MGAISDSLRLWKERYLVKKGADVNCINAENDHFIMRAIRGGFEIGWDSRESW